jgi:two-component system response regulator YesN
MYKVLIIDDDKLARKGLISMVPWEKCGMTVVGDVANGLLGLNFLNTQEVDLAVVDLSMPVLSGLDFIKESRKSYPKLQYVALSFHEDFEYVQSALRLGALDYISKLRMEEEDCTEIFQRIAKIMGKTDEISHATIEAEELTVINPEGFEPEQFEKMLASWQGCRWVYDEGLFIKRMNEVVKSSISLRQMERLLMSISQEIERVFQFTNRVPFLSKKSEGVDWLTGCYENLYGIIDSITDFSVLPICMLYAVKYIKEHLTERLKVEMVARKVNMSRSYFSTSFKNVTGYTFNDFVRYERVELAKKLLQQRKVKPSEVAEAVGYEDSKYFSHIFLTQTGVNCSEYIKQMSSKLKKDEDY